ncbi:MAG: methyltransferase domain-containing protein [Candidatus Dormibacteraeota bacterium]|nr:methyltransferase domain-containing protein [Candidatus Dormibacteraeota bacterium]
MDAIKVARRYNELLFAFVNGEATPPDDVLDFGAGEGAIAERLAQKVRSVVCLEPDTAFRQSLLTRGLPCAADLSAIPNGSLDLIYSLNVLEHIDTDDAVLLELHAKLRDSGRVLLYVPAFQCLYNSMDRVSGHVRRYRLAQLRGKLTRAGFDVENIQYVDCLGFAATLLWKLFDKGSGEISSAPICIYDRYIFPLSRALDLVMHGIVGKNLLVRGRKLGQGTGPR